MLDVITKQMQEDSQRKHSIVETLILKNYSSGTKHMISGYHICSRQSHYTANNVISFPITKINNSLSMPVTIPFPTFNL